MKKSVICSIAILLLFTGCKKCGKDECLGDFSLMTGSKADWYPYLGVHTLTFENSKGEVITLTEATREETMVHQQVREICSHGWWDRADQYYNGEWLTVSYKLSSGTISWSLDITMQVAQIYFAQTLTLYDRVDYSSSVINSLDFNKSVGGHISILVNNRGNQLDSAETYMSIPDYKDEITLNGRTFYNVWYCKSDGKPSLYIRKGQGIIAFAGYDHEIWIAR